MMRVLSARLALIVLVGILVIPVQFLQESFGATVLPPGSEKIALSCSSLIDNKYQDFKSRVGSWVSDSGWASVVYSDGEAQKWSYSGPDGPGSNDVVIIYCSSTGTFETHGWIREKIATKGGVGGSIGALTGDIRVISSDGDAAKETFTQSNYNAGIGVWQAAQNGVMILKKGSNYAYFMQLTGTEFNAINNEFSAQGRERGPLGFPLSDSQLNPRSDGYRQNFEGGTIYVKLSASTAYTVKNGPIMDKWASLTWEQGSLGYPIDNQKTGLRSDVTYQQFEHGYIYHVQGKNAYAVTPGPDSAPILTVPSTSMSVEATSQQGVTVTYSVSATDDVDGPLQVNCDHPSGSTFSVGTTNVNCSATDSIGNTVTKSFSVIVTFTDSGAPLITIPSDITVTATSSSVAAVTYSATATDGVDGAVQVNCSPASGSMFPVGATIVTCIAVDKAGNQGRNSFTVTVKPPPVSTLTDTIAPNITIPGPITASATSGSGAIVTFTVASTDDVDGPLQVNCDHPSGFTFPVGDTLVKCTAVDSAGNRADRSFTVTVMPPTPVSVGAQVSTPQSPVVQPDLRVIVLVVVVQGSPTDFNIQSSSEITSLSFDEIKREISFKVSGDDGTPGVTIVPVGKLLLEPYTIKFDGSEMNTYQILTDEATGDKSIKLTYTHSIHDVVILGSKVLMPQSKVGGEAITGEFPIIYIIAAAGGIAAVGGVVGWKLMKKKRQSDWVKGKEWKNGKTAK